MLRRRLAQRRIEDHRHDPPGGDLDPSHVRLDPHDVVVQALDQSDQLVVVVEDQAIGVAAGAGDAVQKAVSLVAIGRRVKEDPGQRIEREFQRAEQIGLGRQALLVDAGDVGGQQAAVGQDDDGPVRRLCEAAPPSQVVRRHGSLHSAGGKGEPPRIVGGVSAAVIGGPSIGTAVGPSARVVLAAEKKHKRRPQAVMAAQAATLNQRSA